MGFVLISADEVAVLIEVVVEGGVGWQSSPENGPLNWSAAPNFSAAENGIPGDMTCKALECGDYPRSHISIADIPRLAGGAVSPTLTRLR